MREISEDHGISEPQGICKSRDAIFVGAGTEVQRGCDLSKSHGKVVSELELDPSVLPSNL